MSEASCPVGRGFDAEMIELRLQRSALQSQACGSAFGSAKPSMTIAKSAKNTFATLVAKCTYAVTILQLSGSSQFRQRRLQYRSRGKDDRPLDKILQLSDVARPLPTHQQFHRLRGNTGNGLFH